MWPATATVKPTHAPPLTSSPTALAAQRGESSRIAPVALPPVAPVTCLSAALAPLGYKSHSTSASPLHTSPARTPLARNSTEEEAQRRPGGRKKRRKERR